MGNIAHYSIVAGSWSESVTAVSLNSNNFYSFGRIPLGWRGLKIKNSTTFFEFRDNGPEYPPEILDLEQHNIGPYLIRNLVHNDLRGKLELGNDDGAVTKIRFAVEKD